MNFTKDDVLASLGLQTLQPTSSTAVSAVGLFGAGILVGAGLGLLFAPKPGRELRADLAKNAEDLRTRIPEKARDVADQARHLIEGAAGHDERRVVENKPVTPHQH